MACRREVPFGHLASAKSLYPLGQPEKALGHEPQIDPCVANRQPPGLSASGTNPRRRYLIKMQRRWKHKINEGCQGQLATKRLSARRGLEVKLSFLLPVEGEIFFLTSPFIDQAITRFDRWSLSDIEIFRQLGSGLPKFPQLTATEMQVWRGLLNFLKPR